MDTEQIREALASEESRLAAMRDDLRAGDELDTPENLASGGELSVVDQHPADIATEQQQREIDLSMIEQIEAELNDVEIALRKLDEGGYGSCEACGGTIDAERLAALPATRFCIEHASEVRTIAPSSASDTTTPI